MPKSSLRRLEQDFVRATPRQQRTFLMRLPQLLDLSPDDLALLRASEAAFAFWDNPDDAAYDAL
jgi:hypothetical protein